MSHNVKKKVSIPAWLLLIFAGCLLGGCRERPRFGVRVVAANEVARPRRLLFAPGAPGRLLVVEASGRVGVWQVSGATGPEILASWGAGALDAAFAADGATLVTAGFDGRLRRWTLDGRLLWTSRAAHDGPARAVAAAGERIVSGGDDATLRLWTADGAAAGDPLTTGGVPVVSVGVSSQGDLLATVGDGSLRLWRPGSGDGWRERVQVLHRQARPLSRESFASMMRFTGLGAWQHTAVFSPDGATMAGAVFDGAVRIWNADGSLRAEIGEAHGRRQVRGLAFSPRGDLLASAGLDGAVRLWNRDGSPHRQLLSEPGVEELAVDFSPDGSVLATVGSDDRVRLWTLDGAAVGAIPAASPGVTTVALSPSEPLFAYAESGGGARLAALDGSRPAQRIAGDRVIGALAFTSDGGRLATGAADGSVQLWGLDGEAAAGGLPADGRPINALVSSADGRRLAVAGSAFGLLRADGGTWREANPFADTYTALAFGPRGRVIALGSLFGRLELRSSDGGSLTPPLRLPRENIHSLAFAQQGDRLASAGGEERVVRLWHLDGITQDAPLDGHQDVVTALASTPDAATLASGSADGTVRMWTLPARTVDVVDVGLRVDQVGFWRGLLWVRAAGDTLLFYDRARRLVATTLLGSDGVLTYTPDGWYVGASRPRLVDQAGVSLPDGEAILRAAPDRIRAALGGNG